MDTNQILEDLDKHASEFNFPVLDNAYVEFAATRLTGFRGAQDWLVCFEVLGFSTREVAFVDDLYAYGSCIEKGGYFSEQSPLTSAEEQPLFDGETNECIADWSNWSVKVHGQTMSFSPTREEYAEAGIIIDRGPGPGTLKEIELMRFLVHRLGEERLFMSDQVLLGHFPHCRNLARFLQTTQWQHPDVADGEKPSHNISIRSLVMALSQRDLSLFVQGRPNTHWRFWAQAA
ncbi:MAG: DUF7003 family protein [Bryobacteraceae bacterium]|jgi:hypothetical protein